MPHMSNRLPFLFLASSLPLLLIFFILNFFQPVHARQSILFAQQSGGCFAQLQSDPATTYGDVQTAVDNALFGDIVKVSGTCAGVQTRAGIQQTAFISKPLTIRGGYTTTNWVLSDPVLNPTTLDAQLGGRVLLISDTVSFNLENITVTRGRILGDGLCDDISSNCGGGILATGPLTLTNVNVISNTAEREGGGVVAISSATVIGSSFERNTALNVSPGPSSPRTGALTLFAPSSISDSQFISNTSQTSGGAVSAFAEITVTNSLFQENSSLNSVGGGLRVSFDTVLSGTVLISNTTFISNSAQAPSFSGIADGGGIYVFNTNLVVVNSDFENNVCLDSDGDCDGGGIYSIVTPFPPVKGSVTLDNTNFANNSAQGNGGGVSTNGAVTVEGGVFDGNQVEGNVTSFADGGGGIYANEIRITDTVFINNSSGENGGGLLARLFLSLNNAQFIGNSAAEHGGGVYAPLFGSNSTFVTDTIFIDNAALENGGGMYVPGAATTAVFENGRFENNQSFAEELDGGFVLRENGGGGLWANGNVTLNNTEFVNNFALTNGGGAHIEGAAAINGGLFEANDSDGNFSGFSFGGGGLYIAGELTFTNTQFLDNTAVRGGGVMALSDVRGQSALFQSNSVTNTGGAMLAQANLTLTDSQVYSNSAVSPDGFNSGGGIFVSGQAELTNVEFISNVVSGDFGSGGGLSVSDAFTLTNALFEKNNASSNGGGARIQGPFVFENVVFQENSSDGSGGALDSSASFDIAVVNNTQFLSNTAVLNGGAVNHVFGNIFMENSLFQNNMSLDGRGGGLNMSSSIVATNTQFINNRASLDGGGAYVNSNATFTNSLFDRNVTGVGSGGGILVNSTLTLSRTQILNNKAAVNGGGAGINFRVNLEESLFENNLAVGAGGGVWNGRFFDISSTAFINNRADIGGGFAFTTTGGTNANQMVNSLFAENSSTTNGSAIFIDSDTRPANLIHNTISGGADVDPNTAVFIASGPVAITNSIITSHTNGIVNGGGTVNANYNLYFGNGDDQRGPIIGNVGNQFGDPQFVDVAGRNYLISASSLAVNNGVDAGVLQDFEGNERPFGPGFDIGFDEISFELEIVKMAEPASNVLPGQPITYTIIYTNSGNNIVQNVKITDTIPAQLKNVSFTSSGAAIQQTNTNVLTYTWDVEDLMGGAGGTIVITGIVDPELNADTTFTNTVQIGTSASDENVENNESSAVFTATVPKISLTATTLDVNEADGTALLTVAVDEANPWADVTAVYATSNGSATSGLDFTAVESTITIPAGATQASFPVDILDDDLVEGDETFQVTLSNTKGAALSTPDAVIITILDDDTVVVEFSEDAFLVQEDAGLATITVTLSNPSVQPVSVDYATSDDTAVSGEDYTAVSGTLTFPPGSTIMTFTVPILDDALFESAEQVNLTLSGFTNADEGASNPASLIILSDEAVPEVLVYPTTVNVIEGSGSDTFWVVLTTPPSNDVIITISPDSQSEVSTNSLTFTPANWNVPQIVTVTAVLDINNEGPHGGLITNSAASSDPNYNNIPVDDVTTNISEAMLYEIFLPVVFNQSQTVQPSDLMVSDVIVTSDSVTVVIENGGTGPTPDQFWVDLYINPSEVPTINNTWQLIADHGIAWGVTDMIPAGGTLTLTIGDAYFDPDESDFPGIVAGDEVWAFVDSVNLATTYGNIAESDETNNIFGPVP